MSRPNIIIFNPDEMRADVLGHLGSRTGATPNLDSFVEQDAVSFGQAYCQNPVCVPSRCSFLTGLYPHVFGHRTMEHAIDGECDPMLKELKDAGYYVWMNSRNDFIPNDKVEAFRENADTTYFARGPIVRVHNADPAEHPNWTERSFLVGIIPEESDQSPERDRDGLRRMLEFIKRRPADQPFCAFLGLFHPHPPYGIEKRYYDEVDPNQLPDRVPTPKEWEKLPSMMRHLHDEMHLGMEERDWKELQRVYYAMCRKVDDYFGQVVQVLKEEGIYDDTDIYVLSDHGDYMGDYGLPEKNQNTFQDCLTRVPLIMKPHAGVGVAPGIRQELVELVDFYATVMDLAGVTPTHTQFGQSLRQMFGDPSAKGRNYVFCEGGRLKEEIHCMETAPFTLDCYVPRLGGQKDPVHHTKATMIRSHNYKYVKRLYEEDELYDLQKDPMEQENVIGDPAYTTQLTELRLAMLEWYQETCDIVPFRADGRSGSVPQTLVRRYVPKERQEEAMKLARLGGFTLEDFEDRCRKEQEKGEA